MASEERAMECLSTFYSAIDPSLIPPPRPISEWQDENRYGFILGIIQYYPEHSQEVVDLLGCCSKPPSDDTITQKIYDWYDLHIGPFKGPKWWSPCSSVSDYVQEPFHSDLRTAVRARDGVCLFCWDSVTLQTARIIAPKENITEIRCNAVLQVAGLNDVNQTQNGLLLCSKCHGHFDMLNMCVDVVNGKMVVKVINRTNDMIYSERSDSWRVLLSTRNCMKENFKDGRKPTEDDGQMALYFMDNEPGIQPSLKALEFHKTACLIWRMAGGAEEDSDDEWDDADDVGNYEEGGRQNRDGKSGRFQKMSKNEAPNHQVKVRPKIV
ncbi:hypothetical protein HDV05_002566 [Chytridiales sp. JEL 0842]|nr:hypothetical protein HDV05_002566 [Chytridiales sp. JEL 0842]